MVIKHGQEIAALYESTKSADRRLNENERITAGIHELAKNIASMAAEIQLLTKRVDKSIERIEQGLRLQGERIGGIEKSIHRSERNEKELMKHAAKLEAFEREPAEMWEKFKWLIVTGITTAIMGFVMARLL